MNLYVYKNGQMKSLNSVLGFFLGGRFLKRSVAWSHLNNNTIGFCTWLATDETVYF